MVPVISSNKKFAYECLTIHEKSKHNISLSRKVCFCAVKEPFLYSTAGVGVGFKFIKWAPPFPPGGRSALILRLLLPGPKGHVAVAFGKKGNLQPVHY